MAVPFDALRTIGQQTPIPISLEAGLFQGNGGSASDGFPHDLDKTGQAGKDRFNQRIQRSLRQRLPDIIKQVPIDGSGDRDIIHVHLPPEKRPIFQRGENGHRGYGSGDGEPGDIVAPGSNQGNGRRGGHGGEGEGGYDVAVSAEDILRMVFKDWELPDLDEKRAGQMTEDTIRWDDIRKSQATPTDWRRSAKEAIKRTAATKRNDPNYEHGLKIITDPDGTTRHVIDWSQDDLRRRVWNVTEKPITQAVVYAMRDVSGSMGEEEAYAASVMLSWAVRFLQTQYSTVKIVFGFHHSSAKIGITQDEFFNPRESGGTDLKPALSAMTEHIDANYPPEDWNVYPFYVGDGEIFERPDDQELQTQMRSLLDRSRRLFYAETNIRDAQYAQFNTAHESSLMQLIHQLDDPRIISAKVNDRDGIGSALDTFFKKREGREGAMNRS